MVLMSRVTTTMRRWILAACLALAWCSLAARPQNETILDRYVAAPDPSFKYQLVKTIAGERATAPTVADRHLVFGAGGRISVFGDSEDYNNGVGQAGVRILSWREGR